MDYCTSTGGALQGSTCDLGKVCAQNECVPLKSNNNENEDDCIFGDDAVVKDYITNESLSCEKFLESNIKKFNFSRNDCINNQWIKKKCCKTCKVYSKMTCFDKYSNCNELKDFCEISENIKSNCPNSCGSCTSIFRN